MDDSTVSLAGTEPPDAELSGDEPADFSGELVSEEEADGDGVVSGSMQFALNTPSSEIQARVETAAAGGDGDHAGLAAELDGPTAVYTGVQRAALKKDHGCGLSRSRGGFVGRISFPVFLVWLLIG